MGGLVRCAGQVAEEVNELKESRDEEERTSEMGDLLFSLVNLSRWLGIHAEDALRQGNMRFPGTVRRHGKSGSERGLDFPQLPLDEKEALCRR